jgi:hypothetical protein
LGHFFSTCKPCDKKKIIRKICQSTDKVKPNLSFSQTNLIDFNSMSTTFSDKKALNDLDDKRIKEIRPLIPPQILVEDIPLTLKAAQTIVEGRQSAESIIKGKDDRLLVIVGPCSIHDVNAAKEYGKFMLIGPGGRWCFREPNHPL